MKVNILAAMITVGVLALPLAASANSVLNESDSPFVLREGPHGHAAIGEEVWAFVAPRSGSTTRAQVVAELREAQRLGLVSVGGEGDIPTATPQQRQMIALAGLRAQNASPVAMR